MSFMSEKILEINGNLDSTFPDTINFFLIH